MNMHIEDQLRLDMERATGNIRVPEGLALKAYCHRRKRQTGLRVATAAVSATALVGGVAIAGATGAFHSAPPSRTAELTAYVINHVQRALAPAAMNDMIGSVRETYPPTTTLLPVPGGFYGTTHPTSAASPWTVSYTVVWADQATETSRFAAFTSTGQPVFDTEITHVHNGATETAVIFPNSTWWTAPVHAAPPRSVRCLNGGGVYLRDGPGGGWPGFIRSQLACGAYTVTGNAVVGGVEAIKISTSTPGQFTLWVDKASYLPIRLSEGPVQTTFQWLPATPANLANLHLSVPAGFQQVQAPPQPSH